MLGALIKNFYSYPGALIRQGRLFSWGTCKILAKILTEKKKKKMITWYIFQDLITSFLSFLFPIFNKVLFPQHIKKWKSGMQVFFFRICRVDRFWSNGSYSFLTHLSTNSFNTFWKIFWWHGLLFPSMLPWSK